MEDELGERERRSSLNWEWVARAVAAVAAVAERDKRSIAAVIHTICMLERGGKREGGEGEEEEKSRVIGIVLTVSLFRKITHSSYRAQKSTSAHRFLLTTCIHESPSELCWHWNLWEEVGVSPR